MALSADYVDMFAGQFECEATVIEILAVAIHAIMAGKTIGAEGEKMSLGEGNIHLAVAGFTRV